MKSSPKRTPRVPSELAHRGFDDGLEHSAGAQGAASASRRHVDALGIADIHTEVSTNAGTYYCGHAFYLVSQWAQQDLARGAGFLHVPADAQTQGSAPAEPHRHLHTRMLVACALAGALQQHPQRPLRVLLTGYTAFQSVVDNPTGAFVHSDDELRALARLTFGPAQHAIKEDSASNATLRVHHAGPLVVGRLVLPVNDDALHVNNAGSLPWALQTFAPHVVLSMGVHRQSSAHKFESAATTHGMVMNPEGWQHRVGPIDTAHDDVHTINNRWLVQVVQAGALALGLAVRASTPTNA